MNSALRIKIAPATLVLIAMTALGGCVKKIPIVQYPIFWDRAPKTIAVTPFRNQTRVKQIGMHITSDLATRLSANQTYTVYDRTLLQPYLSEQELQRAFSSDQEVAASAMVKIGKVQAILTGAVTTCNWPRTRTEVKVRTSEFFNSDGTSYTRPVKYYIYTNEAELKVNAALLRITPNGPQAIHTCSARGYVKSRGTPPKLSRGACMSIARNQVVQQLLEQFAVIRKMIKVNPSEVFFTASDQPYAGEWPKTKEFSISSGQKIVLVLMLPPQCDRNSFKITVTREEGRTELAAFNVRWTKAMSATGKQFILNPADLAAKGGGPGDYVIRLFSGQPKPALVHKIKIEP